jgi:hypothetical protein
MYDILAQGAVCPHRSGRGQSDSPEDICPCMKGARYD